VCWPQGEMGCGGKAEVHATGSKLDPKIKLGKNFLVEGTSSKEKLTTGGAAGQRKKRSFSQANIIREKNLTLNNDYYKRRIRIKSISTAQETPLKWGDRNGGAAQKKSAGVDRPF